MSIKILVLVLFILIGLCLYITLNYRSITGQGESSAITYEQILELKPDIIYLAGKGASGKTTLSNTLADEGNRVLHVDEIIRDGFQGQYPTKWGALPELHEKITNILISAIDSAQKPVILEGIIHKSVLTTIINKYKPTIIWVQHRTRESYIQALKQRASHDIESNKSGNALGAFWEEPNAKEAIEDYKQNGINGAIFTKYIEDDVDYNLGNLVERRESLFKDWDYKIYYTDLLANNAVVGNATEEIIIDIKTDKHIIGHIAGSSGVGKTYHAEILAKKYKDIEFKDLDELIGPIHKNKKTFSKDVKNAINTYIESVNKPIVFVGYNDYIIDETHFWINIPNNKYFLTDESNEIIERRLKRYKHLKKKDPSAEEIADWISEIVKDGKLYRKKIYRFVDHEELYHNLDYQISMIRKRLELDKLAWRPIIIHVSGPSGVGKTTLANKLKTAPNLDVYDSDDIMDNIIRQLFKNHLASFKKSVLEDDSKQLDILYQKDIINKLFEIFDNAVKNKHNVVILGITVDLTIIANYKYMIDLPPSENYVRRTKREIGTICDNRKQIEKLLDGDPVIADIGIFNNIGHRTKIIEVYGKEIKKIQEIRDFGKILGYKLLPSSEIEKQIYLNTSKQTL